MFSRAGDSRVGGVECLNQVRVKRSVLLAFDRAIAVKAFEFVGDAAGLGLQNLPASLGSSC
jgi:hypothetical protein